MRLCEHKLEIVREALKSDPALCKDSAKVSDIVSSQSLGEGATVGIKTCQAAWIKECQRRGRSVDW